MRETTGNLDNLRITSVERSEALERLPLIHRTLPVADLEALVADVQERYESETPPIMIEAAVDNQTVATAYFKSLPGNVATLGGVNCAPACEDAAVRLLEVLVGSLEAARVAQIQAIVHPTDLTTGDLLQRAGFVYLTSVLHLWFDVRNAPKRRSLLADDGQYSWRPARELSSRQFRSLLQATFEQTLDCPSLNGLRNSSDVLDGFLEGRPFKKIDGWYVLRAKKRHIGCVLLTEHSGGVTELVYMGLEHRVRGRRLGRLLIHKAVEVAKEHRSSMVVAAVDQQNWPALQLYADQGFQQHQSLAVWLKPPG